MLGVKLKRLMDRGLYPCLPAISVSVSGLQGSKPVRLGPLTFRIHHGVVEPMKCRATALLPSSSYTSSALASCPVASTPPRRRTAGMAANRKKRLHGEALLGDWSTFVTKREWAAAFHAICFWLKLGTRTHKKRSIKAHLGKLFHSPSGMSGMSGMSSRDGAGLKTLVAGVGNGLATAAGRLSRFTAPEAWPS